MRGSLSRPEGGAAAAGEVEEPLVVDVVPVHFPRESFRKTYIFHIFNGWITLFLWHMRRSKTGLRETMVCMMLR